MAGSCVYGDEPLGSIKCGKFFEYLRTFLASLDGLCSMELVSYTLYK